MQVFRLAPLPAALVMFACASAAQTQVLREPRDWRLSLTPVPSPADAGEGRFTPAAQTSTRQFDAVVISASRTEQRLADALPHVTLITREEIESSQAPDALTLLARLAGVETAQLGGIGRQAGIFLRGSSTRHTLVLVDGVPINNLNFSAAALEHVQAAQIDRIEIVRGNVSALYGSQAVGGVIQIFTRTGQGEPGASARVAAGSRDTLGGDLAVHGAVGDWRYAASASTFKTAGFNAIDQGKRPGTNPDQDGYENFAASGQLAYTWLPGQELGVRAFHSRGEVEYDSEFGPATQADESRQTVDAAGVWSRNRLASWWTWQITVAKQRDDLDADITAFPFFVTSDGTQFAWQHDFTLAADWTASLAAERLEQKIDSDSAYTTNERSVNTARAGTIGRAGAHQVQLGVRHDGYSDFGSATTYFAGYGLTLAEVWKLTASLSSAFNAPTFNDLHSPFGGNPNLQPEKARAAELGVQYAKDKTLARLALFRTRYRDLIGLDASFNAVNIGRAMVEGAEAALSTM
ncbi:MAG TPA: TonB-dependent receptor, partial [Burkholderiaceae bacterium]|nr:TonB-dependent receptor [Burkholderiaceae bacterium]